MTTSETARNLVNGLARGLQWLAALIWAGSVYVWRCVVDAIGQARIGYVWIRTRKTEAGPAEVARIRARVRSQTETRWAAWRGEPPLLKAESRIAAGALAIVLVLIARAHFTPAAPAARPDAADALRGAARTRAAADETKPSDFGERITSAKPGEWVFDNTPLLAPERLGAWDDFKVGSPIVLDEPGRLNVLGVGTRYRLWYRGCRFMGDEYSCGVGYATSRDGLSWTRHPGPVFVPADPLDRDHLDMLSIVHGAGSYMLWYSVDADWVAGRRRATVRAASSPDGLTWTDRGVVHTAAVDGVRLPVSGTWDGQRFHLWIVDSQSAIDPKTNRFPPMQREGDDAIVHFTSPDGVRLTAAGVAPVNPMQLTRPALRMYGPEARGFRAIDYERFPQGRNPQGLVTLRSSDGDTWTRDADASIALDISALPASITGPVVVTQKDGGMLMWYTAQRRRGGGEEIRLAYHKDTVR